MINQWRLSDPVLYPGPAGSFDETAVKDPSVVFFGNCWHVFYTARGNREYTTGYVCADTLEALSSAPHDELPQVRGRTRYGCAPQVFFFRPQQRWYLIFQSTDATYQPMFVSTETIHRPESWSAAQPLLVKDTSAKWIDFWILCDDTTAYLYYTENHDSVMARTTSLRNFPRGWGGAQPVFSGVHEAVHVYKVQGRAEFHLIYERNTGERSFGLAQAPHPLGPWIAVTDSYATGNGLTGAAWSETVSHGEAIRAGFDERMEYDAQHPMWLVQGLTRADYVGPYPEMPWKLGIITPNKQEVVPCQTHRGPG